MVRRPILGVRNPAQGLADSRRPHGSMLATRVVGWPGGQVYRCRREIRTEPLSASTCLFGEGVTRMSFDNRLLKPARQGELFLDCHEMELRQNHEDCPPCFRGPGYIKQDTEGRLEFKVFVRETENYSHPGAGHWKE